MTPEIDIDGDALFQQAMQQTVVKAALQARASRIAALARKDLARAGIDASVTIRPHALPSGRASLDVGCEVDDKYERRVGRIMRRAARGGR
ncbi:hypothetical protein CCICO_04410 [Corynebacterium ciconiae DSM 44920]|uniref:hypothetical protein n=1 Tax=Corynebacterium ciconiae TaxID=227319 RepID=UPI0026476102|nr:hypothetical protein [Corynebacterium ciconiae]WKD60919.1 hypothetical protein CCICO_04410 [Corynebacterium ciconiae DSM 44920]